jgi:hypothetical protein
VQEVVQQRLLAGGQAPCKDDHERVRLAGVCHRRGAHVVAAAVDDAQRVLRLGSERRVQPGRVDQVEVPQVLVGVGHLQKVDGPQ